MCTCDENVWNGWIKMESSHIFWFIVFGFFSSRHSFLLPESLQHLHVHSVNGYSNVDHFNLDQIIQNFRLGNWFSVVLVPLENTFLIWRRYYCRWRAEKFGFCSSLIASEQGGNFFYCSMSIVTQGLGSYSKDRPIQSPLTISKGTGLLGAHFNPDTQNSITFRNV